MNEDTCVCCGAQIPEGRQICWSCEHIGDQDIKIPSDAQIELANSIAETLEIDFPQTSKDFTAYVYWRFINDNIRAAKEYWDECEGNERSDDMDWFSPLNS